ncbi:MAG TPA: DUF2815 family protein [Clostridia bacterium]|nr:DUF2815 family protein [Clostridia bacterium]
MANENHVVTGKARLSYVHLLQPYANRNSSEEKFSVTVLIPKTDVATKQRIDAALEAATQAGVKLWGGRPPRIAIPVYDGDGTRPSDGMPFGPECKGHWVFTASCKKDKPPRIVDANVQDIMDSREIYSGIFGRVGVDFFPYNQAGKKGIGCGLTNVQKLADGDPLGNRTTAEEDFGAPAYGQYQQPATPSYSYPPQGYGTDQYTSRPQQVDPLTGLPM